MAEPAADNIQVGPADRIAAEPGPVYPPNHPGSAPAPSNPAFETPPVRPAPRLDPQADLTGIGYGLAPLAALVAHRGTETPLTIGLLGPSGSGTSDATRRLVNAGTGLAGKSGAVSRLIPVEIDAAGLSEEPAAEVADAVWDALVATGDPDLAMLAEDATHALRDPHDAAREANERLSEARRRLEAERRALEETEGRRARLAETVLYETAGTKIDTYARANRAAIEGRMRRFGFVGADPIPAWKGLVRTACERGPSGRFSSFLSALWTYQGQARLVVTGIILLAAAWALGAAQANHQAWLTWLNQSGNAQAAGASSWMQAHLGWLSTMSTLFLALGLLCLVLNVWGAFRFEQPIWRGAALLAEDLAQRRQALDSAAAQQTRHVDSLTAEVDAASRRAASAERRAAEHGREPAMAVSPFRGDDARLAAQSARRFLRALSDALTTSGGSRRLLVTLDGLSERPVAEAARLAGRIRHLLAAPGFLLVVAADPASLPSDAFDLAYRIDTGLEPAEIMARLTGAAAPLSAPPLSEETLAWIAAPLGPDDRNLLQTLAPLAGPTPRGLKRFLLLYRVNRQEGASQSAIALALALASGGSPQERAAWRQALAEGPEGEEPTVGAASPRLSAALAALRASGHPVTRATARQAEGLVAPYLDPARG